MAYKEASAYLFRSPGETELNMSVELNSKDCLEKAFIGDRNEASLHSFRSPRRELIELKQ